MFNIVFYDNKSDYKRLDKTSGLNEIATISGTLREECSIMQPKITIQSERMQNVIDDNFNDVIANSSKIVINEEYVDILNANYCYIEKFKRYYFINNIVSVRNGVWQIETTCDVLMSFKEDIKNLNCYIGRQEFIFDKFLMDKDISFKTDRTYEIIEGNEPTGNYYFKPLSTDNEYSFRNQICITTATYNNTYQSESNKTKNILSVNGQNTVTYFVTPSQLQEIMRQVYSTETLQDTNKNVYIEPSQQIISIKIFPFDFNRFYTLYPNDVITGRAFIVGTKEFEIKENNLKQWFMSPRTGVFKVPFGSVNITGKYNNFIDYSSYTTVNVYIPYVGVQAFDTALVMNKTLTFYAIVDCVDDNSKIEVYCNNVLINTYSTRFSIDVPIVQSNTNNRSLLSPLVKSQNTTSRTKNALSNLLGIGGSLATAGISAYTGHALGVAGGIVGAISSFSNLILDYKQDTTQTKIDEVKTNWVDTNWGTFGGSTTDFLTTMKPLAIIQRPKPIYWDYNVDDEGNVSDTTEYDENNDYLKNYAHTMGRPCSTNSLLKDLQGFTVVYGCHIENIKNATSNEQVAIDNLLKKGILI